MWFYLEFSTIINFVESFNFEKKKSSVCTRVNLEIIQ